MPASSPPRHLTTQRKFTARQVRNILNNPASKAVLAKRYRVAVSTITQIRQGRTYKAVYAQWLPTAAAKPAPPPRARAAPAVPLKRPRPWFDERRFYPSAAVLLDGNPRCGVRGVNRVTTRWLSMQIIIDEPGIGFAAFRALGGCQRTLHLDVAAGHVQFTPAKPPIVTLPILHRELA